MENRKSEAVQMTCRRGVPQDACRIFTCKTAEDCSYYSTYKHCSPHCEAANNCRFCKHGAPAQKILPTALLKGDEEKTGRCPICGAVFLRVKKASNPRVYCSERCRDAAARLRREKKAREKE